MGTRCRTLPHSASRTQQDNSNKRSVLCPAWQYRWDTLCTRFGQAGVCIGSLLPAGGDDCTLYNPGQEDCDDNGIGDACDIAFGDAIDVNEDDIPDECQCRADLNRNGSVEAGDLGLLIAAWGTDGSVIEDSDLDGDGVVRSSDLGLLLSAWGLCP